MIKAMTGETVLEGEEGETLPSVPDDFYTPLEEAVYELRRRQGDSRLRKEVQDYLGYVPLFLRDKPKVMMGRFIATPNYEMFRFLNLARKLNMEPVVTELSSDKFCTRNPDKLSLAHMPFYRGKDKAGKTSFEYYNVCDCTKYQGKPLCDITTYTGENLMDLHHRLLSSSVASAKEPIVADDAPYLSCDRKPRLYYSHFLPRFICHGILFESFVTNQDEQVFFTNVVFPAFTEVRDCFGVKPLIVPLLPEDTASDVFWRCYPYDLRGDVLRSTQTEYRRLVAHS